MVRIDPQAAQSDAFCEKDGYLALFVERAPAPMAMLDREMRYVAASRRWREIYRLGDQPLVGRSHYDLFPEIPDAWRALHRRCLAGELLREDNDRFVRADGSVQWLRWEMRPWVQPDGLIGGLVIYFEDLTEQVVVQKTNAELALAAASAAAANQAKDAFLAAMSHELRTPLNAIIGFTTVLLEGSPGALNEEQRRQLAMVRDSGHHLLDVVVRIIEVAEAATKEPAAAKMLAATRLVDPPPSRDVDAS
jgi:PAS domain S-box-containing protein